MEARDNPYECRLKRFAFAAKVLVSIAESGKGLADWLVRCEDGLPEGCEIMSVYVTHEQTPDPYIWVVVAHPAFEPVATGHEIPVITPRFVREWVPA